LIGNAGDFQDFYLGSNIMPSFFSPRRYTFRGKLLLAFLLMNAVLIPFSVSTRTAHTRDMIFERELNAINNIGHLVANEVANDLRIHDESALMEELLLSVQQTHIVFVSVLDTQRIVIFSTDSSMTGRPTPYADSRAIEDEKERLFIADFPLLKYSGSVQIGYSLDGVKTDLDKAFRWSVGLGGAMLFLTLLIAWWMSGILAEPLNRMIEITRCYATGDFSARVPVTSRDNIGELGRTLNDMAAQLRDLTDNMQEKIKEKTRLLEESNRKLMELDKLKSDFVAMVSHELRTPLTSIIGFAKTMQSLHLTIEQQRDYLRIIEIEGKRLAELIEEYLDISKIESGNFALKMAPFDFIEMAKETTDSLNVLYGSRISLRIVEPVPQVIGDRNMLKRVIINIIDNACKYSPAESPVTMTVQTREGRIVVSVEDSGPGIPVEDNDRIFEKFYRGKNGASGRYRGTGLGLAISRGLVEAHDGTIHLACDRNPGTTVIIEVPVTGPVMKRECA
jgi:signal transduction histidine kinase